MRFTLVYQGELPPNGNATEKWRIRRAMEPQLRRLWCSAPFNEAIGKYQDPTYSPADCYLGRQIDEFEYIPLISDRISLRAEIDLLLLSSSLPGGLLHGGDIDNRLKTLFDAMSVPASQQQIPKSASADIDKRVFCLLDDDRLVTRLTVSNDRLLTTKECSREIIALIQVRPIAFRVTFANISITS